MKTAIYAGLLLAGLGLFLYLSPAARRADDFPSVDYEGGRLDLVDGLRILRLAGDPHAKGLAHGRAFARDIRGWLAVLRPEDAGEATFAIETCGGRLLPFVPDDARAEMQGIADGADVRFEEILFLNTRFELAAYGFVKQSSRRPAFQGDAAVGEGPEVLRELSADDVGGRADELVVFVHEDRAEPLVLVGLPGMVGGFAGLRGASGATIKPLRSDTPPVLHGLVWPLFLRLLLERPPEPGGPLPALPTLPASLPLCGPKGVATLNVAPSGATWFAAPGGFAAASEEAVTGSDGTVSVGERRDSRAALLGEAARRALIRARRTGVIIRLKGGRTGVQVTLDRHGRRSQAVVRYWRTQ